MQELEQAVTDYVEKQQPPEGEQPEQTPVEQQEEHQQPEPQPSESETQARAQGWVPKEEFHGNPDDWRDADAFLEVGERIASRRRNDELQQKLNRQEKDYQDRFDRLEKTNNLALQRERERIAADYESQKRSAAELGDLDRYDQLDRDRDEALKGYDESLKQVEPDPQNQADGQQPQLPPEIATKLTSWVDNNPWMKRDEVMASAAIAYYNQLERDKPGLTIDELLSETSSFARKTFPDKFARPSAPAQPSAVEGGGGRQTNAAGGKMTAANLPAEARKAAEGFISDGLFKDMNEYAAAYFAEDNT